MDDCISSVPTEQDANEFRTASTQHLKNAGMELRKWRGNVFETNPEAGKTVLGLTWSTETDCLSLVVPKDDQKGNGSWSRRSLLKAVASLFDP